jgi:hypothetical protein
MNLPRLSATENSAISHRGLTRKRASVSPINPWSDTRETLLPTVLQLLRHCWRGHVTPSQYSWSVTSCACVEVCLPIRNLETDRVTSLFHCLYVYYLETADSVAQPLLVWGKYATIFSSFSAFRNCLSSVVFFDSVMPRSYSLTLPLLKYFAYNAIRSVVVLSATYRFGAIFLIFSFFFHYFCKEIGRLFTAVIAFVLIKNI